MLWPLFVLRAGSFTQAERIQGYAQRGDTTVFIFDEEVYALHPQRVILEGSMRQWDHDLNKPQWWLHRQSKASIWTLSIPNPDFTVIAPGASFKFRINQGRWLDPPAGAENVRRGNLIFAGQRLSLKLRAEIVSATDIRLQFNRRPSEYDYHPDHYLLVDSKRGKIPIERVLYSKRAELQLIPVKKVDIRRLHYITFLPLQQTVPVTYDGWFRHLYSDVDLGANYDAATDSTVIRIFIPRADSVFVYLYRQPFTKANWVYKMNKEDNGIWSLSLAGNWEGRYYDFTAFGANEPGNHFSSSRLIHFTDPYGRVSVDSFGPCRIWPEIKPARPLPNGIPAMQDVVAYEVHVQDFTRNLPLPDSLKGTFKGFIQSGLINSHGAKIGFDHLLDLGINVVHLMPVQEYLHYPDREWKAAFENDPYMIAQGINKEDYQWGYRTSHAFALESRYRVKGSPWGAQNAQFRDLVEAFHEHGLAVIVDLVFNHTAERMDGRQFYFNFAAMDIPYFYRTDAAFNYLGAYGTETKSEDRPMVQRWIVDQCTALVDQYGIDGFRIDLAALTDKQTLRMVRQAVGPDKIIYGEPWINPSDTAFIANPDWRWSKEDAPITFFQDDSRNAFKGPPDNPKNKRTDRGYAGGSGQREAVKKALAAGFSTDKSPLSGINYLDIHDNWALADRFAAHNWDGRFGVDEGAVKIAATLLFTSLGPIVIQGGTEFLRSKGSAPLKEVVKYLDGKPLYFHGKRDTYNLARANAFIWEDLGLNRGDNPNVYCNYQNMFEFWKGLIALRKSKYGKVFRIAEKPPQDYYRWIEPANKRLLGYIVHNTVLVLLNTDDKEGAFHFDLPGGRWILIGDKNRIDLQQDILNYPVSTLKGPGTQKIHLGKQSLLIWVKKE